MVFSIRKQGNKRDMKRRFGKPRILKYFTAGAFVLLWITHWFTYFNVSLMLFAFKWHPLSGKGGSVYSGTSHSGGWTLRSIALGASKASCLVDSAKLLQGYFEDNLLNVRIHLFSYFRFSFLVWQLTEWHSVPLENWGADLESAPQLFGV